MEINRDERGGVNMHQKFELAKPDSQMTESMFTLSDFSNIVIIVV